MTRKAEKEGGAAGEAGNAVSVVGVGGAGRAGRLGVSFSPPPPPAVITAGCLMADWSPISEETKWWMERSSWARE